MAILQSLQRLLDEHQIRYEVHAHPRSFTAKETAAAAPPPPPTRAGSGGRTARTG